MERRLRRLEDAVRTQTRREDIDAMVVRVAAEEGVDPEELRADAYEFARRCAGLSGDACLELVAAEEGWTLEEIDAVRASIEARIAA